MEVYVIRHTPVSTEKGVCYGQSEVPLADSFPQDAKEIASKLPNDFERVYCSPLQRCKDLAKALNSKNPVFENALKEFDFGEWENKKWDDMNRKELDRWMEDFVNVKAPGGENLKEMHARVKAFFESLRQKKEEKVLIITHAGVIRCLWACLLDIPLGNIFKIPVAYKEVLVFNLGEYKNQDYIKQLK